MSSFLPSRYRSRLPEPTEAGREASSWYTAPGHRSNADLPKAQHPNRAFGISSIKDLARRGSRQTLSGTSVNQEATAHNLRASSSLYGTLRDQCRPPESIPTISPDSANRQSHDSSIEAITPDQSGISYGSSDPTTPSPAKPGVFSQVGEGSSPPKSEEMGQKSSRSVNTQDVDASPTRGSTTDINFEGVRGRQESHSTDQKSKSGRSESRSTPRPPPLRPAIITTPNIPRRRSSLTAINLNASNFDSLDPNQPTLQHRASTLTEPRQSQRRPSTLSDTLRPVIASITGGTPTSQHHQTRSRETLSPPLLSSPLLASHQPSVESQALSSKIPVLSPSIRLPKTFPVGFAIPVPAPPLTITHYQCYQGHRRVSASWNVHCPVPCMTCGVVEGKRRWKCTWCCLRICGSCMSEFDRQGRNLTVLVAWIAKQEADSYAAKGQAENEKQERLNGLGSKTNIARPGVATSAIQHSDSMQEVGKALEVALPLAKTTNMPKKTRITM